MRLWHHELIAFLPKGQLLAQWRELNSVFAKQDRHILIDYIYDYPKQDLYVYTQAVIKEMRKRSYRIRSFEKMDAYFADMAQSNLPSMPFEHHHNLEYLNICYFNLYEKFLRGQQDFSAQQFEQLQQYCLKNSQ